MFPELRKNFLTLPAPPKCAAAKIPDSVIFIPFIVLPIDRLISFLNIHLFTLHKAKKAFSCNSGLFKKS